MVPTQFPYPLELLLDEDEEKPQEDEVEDEDEDDEDEEEEDEEEEDEEEKPQEDDKEDELLSTKLSSEGSAAEILIQTLEDDNSGMTATAGRDDNWSLEFNTMFLRPYSRHSAPISL